MRNFIFALFLFLLAAQGGAQELSAADRDKALAVIKKWRGFEGTWEGEVRYTIAPNKDWYAYRISLKILYFGKDLKVLVRQGVEDWRELGLNYRIVQPDELTLIIHSYSSGGVWTENNVVFVTRRTEDSADVFIQRVVNNWAGKSLPGEDLVYSTTRAGKVKRIGG